MILTICGLSSPHRTSGECMVCVGETRGHYDHSPALYRALGEMKVPIPNPLTPMDRASPLVPPPSSGGGGGGGGVVSRIRSAVAGVRKHHDDEPPTHAKYERRGLHTHTYQPPSARTDTHASNTHPHTKQCDASTLFTTSIRLGGVNIGRSSRLCNTRIAKGSNNTPHLLY